MKKTIYALLEERLKKTPDRTYLNYREGAGWKTITWKEYGDGIERLSRALIGYGITEGDMVSLIGKASPEWFVCDMSVMTLGGTVAPIYVTSSGQQIRYILNHSGARLLFVDDIDQYRKIEGMFEEIPRLEKVVLMKGTVPKDAPKLMTLDEFLVTAEGVSAEKLATIRDAVTEDMVSTLIYTSGTTGDPKAVMLTQKNCHVTALCIDVWLEFLHKQTDTILNCCLLTLAHVYERAVSLLGPLTTGASIYFCDLNRAVDELREVQPTLVVGLPRTWEKIFETIMTYRDSLPAAKREVFDWAVETGFLYNRAVYEKRGVSVVLRLKHLAARKLVINKIVDTIGIFKNAKHVMTGGAVSSREVVDFFFALGVWICQVYGQTESHGVGSVETRDYIRFGSVGKPFPFTEITVSDDSEIMIKSDMVSAGYYKDPDLTAETFRGGWLYTGDLGYVDRAGYLFITGRKKDIIITSGAKNISPAKIEASLMAHPLIEHAILAGDGKKYVVALVTLSVEGGAAFTAARGVAVSDYEGLCAVKEIEREIERHVHTVNEKLSRVEQIKKFSILPEPLSVGGGEMTSLLKVKRYAVIQKYKKEIDAMYS